MIISKKELTEALKNVLSVEIGARDSYTLDVKLFKDSEIKNNIEKIRNDEIKHIEILTELIKVLEE